MSNYYQEVKKYFNDKAEEYDDVDDQLYCVLSDEYYKRILKKELTQILKDKKSIKLLDAGAGTGRWTMIFHELFKDELEVKGDLIDISENMLVFTVSHKNHL